MIKVDTIDIPTPSGYQVGIMDLSKAERSSDGTMNIDRIATKRKIELTYAYLSQSQASSLLQKVSGVFFDVEYIDPQDGTTKTGTFYAGDRTAEALDYQNGVVRWKNVKFNIIER